MKNETNKQRLHGSTKKCSKFWSICLEHFDEHNPLTSEEWSAINDYTGKLLGLISSVVQYSKSNTYNFLKIIIHYHKVNLLFYLFSGSATSFIQKMLVVLPKETAAEWKISLKKNKINKKRAKDQHIRMNFVFF